jgi:hypothetical protein
LRKYIDEPSSVREVSRLRLESAIAQIGFAETGNPLWKFGPAMQHEGGEYMPQPYGISYVRGPPVKLLVQNRGLCLVGLDDGRSVYMPQEQYAALTAKAKIREKLEQVEQFLRAEKLKKQAAADREAREADRAKRAARRKRQAEEAEQARKAERITYAKQLAAVRHHAALQDPRNWREDANGKLHRIARSVAAVPAPVAPAPAPVAPQPMAKSLAALNLRRERIGLAPIGELPAFDARAQVAAVAAQPVLLGVLLAEAPKKPSKRNLGLGLHF